MARRFALIGLSMVVGLSSTTLAQEPTNLNGSTNTITTAVPFLRISPDARSGAMGDVGVAISPDANAQFWNVSKMPFNTKRYGVSMTYTPWLKDLVPDIFLAYIAGYAKFGQDDAQAISASLRYFSLGEINYTDINANPIGSGNPNEFSLDVGYSQKLSPYLSVGLSMRYIHSALTTGLGSGSQFQDTRPGNAFGADLGMYYTRTKEIDEFRNTNFSFGAVLSNVGSKITYNNIRRDFIPINLGLGAAYTYQMDEYNKVTAALDVNKLLVPSPQYFLDSAGQPVYYYPEKGVISGMLGSFGDAPEGFKEELREFQVSAGAEYWYQNQFAVRAGYFWEHETKGARKYFTAGLGVRYNVFNLNFSYLIPSGNSINRNPLSNTFRFSLLFEFDGKTKESSSSTTTP